MTQPKVLSQSDVLVEYKGSNENAIRNAARVLTMSEKVSNRNSNSDRESTEGRPPVNWRLVDLMLRTGLLVMMVVWLGWTLLNFVNPRLATNNSKPTNIVASDELAKPESKVPGFIWSDLLNGEWQLGDSGWATTSQTVDVFPDESWFEATPLARRFADSIFDDMAFIKIFEKLGARQSNRGELIYRVLKHGKVTASLHSTVVDGVEIVQNLRMATPAEVGFSLVEAKPADSRTGTATALLPVNDRMQRLANRSSDGTVSSNILTFEGSEHDILRFWETQGWTNVYQQPTPAGNLEVHLKKNSIVVAATFMITSDPASIVLVRLPN